MQKQSSSSHLFRYGIEGERKVDATPHLFFDLCSDLILEIYNLVHPILTAPWHM